MAAMSAPLEVVQCEFGCAATLRRLDDLREPSIVNKPVGIDYALLAAIGLAWGSQFVFNELAIESFHP